MSKNPHRIAVTGDGLLARRVAAPLTSAAAERYVRSLNNLPTILEAWTQAIPRSERQIVCWLPASVRAQAELEADFVRAERAKAEAEGAEYQWSRSPLGPQHRLCHNPRSGGSYLVTRIDPTTYRCQCHRFLTIGLCKHVLDAVLRRRFEEPDVLDARN